MSETKSSPNPTTELRFTDLNLSAPLLQSIQELGFETPSPIQAQALPILLGDRTDFLGLAATGTGKTAAFAIPLLEKIDPTLREVQALVLCPTRELAIQVSEQVNLLGKHLGLKSVPVYGGAGYGDQIRGIQRGAPIVVGTPGRIQDHIDQGTLSLDNVNLVVLDEADEMISMGFRDAIESILRGVDPEYRNIWLFSATMSRDVRKVADEFLESPKQVEVNRKEMLPENIEQLYYVTQESNKPEVLCKLIEAADGFYGLIFCQTKALVADLTFFLQDRGYTVDSLHGDKDQKERERTLKAFRERRVSVLVCTDVAARGIDVKDVTHVINYSIPRELDSYVHRIGRTARSGNKGFAFSLISPAQRGMILKVERLTKRKLFEGKIPTRKEIGAKKIRSFLDKWKGEAVSAARAQSLMGPEWAEAMEGLTGVEVAARFVAAAYPEIFKELEKASEEKAQKASRSQDPVKLDSNQKIVLPEPPARRERRFEDREERGFSDRGPKRQFDRPSYGKKRMESAPLEVHFEQASSGGDEGQIFEPKEAGRSAPRSSRKPEFLDRDSKGDKGGFRKEGRSGFKKFDDGFKRKEGGFKKREGGFGAKDKGFKKSGPRRDAKPASGKGFGERALRRSDF